MTQGDWSAVWVTLKLASLVTLILLLLAIPLAWWLVHNRVGIVSGSELC